MPQVVEITANVSVNVHVDDCPLPSYGTFVAKTLRDLDATLIFDLLTL